MQPTQENFGIASRRNGALPETTLYLVVRGRAVATCRALDDWTPEEEAEPGIVRGVHVQWSPKPQPGFVVPTDDDDDVRHVFITGTPPDFTFDGWITVGEAREKGFLIGHDS